MAAWQPQPGPLEQLCGLLSRYGDPHADHRALLAQLEESRRHPEFLQYLAFVLARGEAVPPGVRQAAGLLLKNALKAGGFQSLAPAAREMIQAALLGGLGHEAALVRNTVGTAVASVVGCVGLAGWPALAAHLPGALTGPPGPGLLGALDATRKIAEEHGQALGEPVAVGAGGAMHKPVDALFPALVGLLGAPELEIKAQAFAGIHEMMERLVVPGGEVFMRYVRTLFALAGDGRGEVRKLFCRGVVQILEQYPEVLEAQMQDLIAFMLQLSRAVEDEDLAMEASEFWTALCLADLSDATRRLLQPVLAPLTTILMDNMVYRDHDEAVLEAEAEEARGPAEDKDSEIKPAFGRAAAAGVGGADEEDGADDDDDGFGSWNLRKSSAQGLDSLSEIYGHELLPILLPLVEARARSPTWQHRETAILALGAVCEGCQAGLRPHLAQVLASVTGTLKDPRPLVRSVSCWTLGRYSGEMAAAESGPGAGPELAGRMAGAVRGLLEALLDPNRQVQHAACSALATFAEAAPAPALLAQAPLFAEAMARALQVYGRKNAGNLYDLVATFIEQAGPLADAHAAAVLEPLVRRFLATAVAGPRPDVTLVPLTHCLASVAPRYAAQFRPVAGELFARAFQIVVAQLQLQQRELQEQQQPPPLQGAAPAGEYDREFVIAELDFLAALVLVLKEAVGPAVGPHATSLTEVLLHCCRGDNADAGVRQSAFGLAGELAAACPGLVLAAPASPEGWAALVAESLAPARLTSAAAMATAGNACWAFGEMVGQLPAAAVEPCALPLVERLAPLMGRTSGAGRGLRENAALATGRLAARCPDLLAPHLQHFIWNWCSALGSLSDGAGKQGAFAGLMGVVRRNPNAALGGFAVLCEALGSWQAIEPPELAAEVIGVLGEMKAHLEAKGQWGKYLEALRPGVLQKLGRMGLVS